MKDVKELPEGELDAARDRFVGDDEYSDDANVLIELATSVSFRFFCCC